ncbi:MAG TPA: DinB family protein [Terriglobales bacterium]|nr:DinB family protein [Terriglobales bacterium]
MKSSAMSAPQSSEYALYYGKYVALVPEGDIVSILSAQLDRMDTMLFSLADDDATTPYAPGKWTVKQVLGHITDAERVFTYRALRIARGDKTPLPGFEQDDYVANADFNSLSLTELLQEYSAVRRATIMLFRHLPAEAWTRRGTASNNEVTVRALAYITAGHDEHHYRILWERYAIGKSVGKS